MCSCALVQSGHALPGVGGAVEVYKVVPGVRYALCVPGFPALVLDTLYSLRNMSDDGKLFIGGLSFDTSDRCLAEVFEKYGEIINTCVVKDRETNRSRGFGFVTFANPEDAKDAMQALNGKTIDGRQIRVDQAGKSSGERRGGRGGSGGRGSYRGRGGGDRGYGGSSRFDRPSGGYSSSRGGSRDYGRSQGGYGGDRSGGSYRDGYDSYATHNE